MCRLCVTSFSVCSYGGSAECKCQTPSCGVSPFLCIALEQPSFPRTRHIFSYTKTAIFKLDRSSVCIISASDVLEPRRADRIVLRQLLTPPLEPLSSPGLNESWPSYIPHISITATASVVLSLAAHKHRAFRRFKESSGPSRGLHNLSILGVDILNSQATQNL